MGSDFDAELAKLLGQDPAEGSADESATDDKIDGDDAGDAGDEPTA
jgi:hypothetical protein